MKYHINEFIRNLEGKKFTVSSREDDHLTRLYYDESEFLFDEEGFLIKKFNSKNERIF